MFEQIIFLQDGNETTEEALNIYENKGAACAINFLSQWHYPSEHETNEEAGYGSSDIVHELDGYVLSVNTSLGYIGLAFNTEVIK